MKRRWNLADATAVGVIGLLLVSLLSMRITRQRGAARRSTCENNLKQFGLGFHNYHSAYKQLPMGSGGTDPGSDDNPLAGNSGRLSAFVGLTPFMEQQQLWEMISNPLKSGSNEFPSMGPVPWFDANAYAPWSMRPEVLVCPADSASTTHTTAASYVLNYGDGVYKVFYGRGDWPSPNDTNSARVANASQRGLFGRQRVYKFRDVLDGLSNTLMVAESRITGSPVAKNVAGLPMNPSLAIAAQKGKSFWPVGREARWCDGLLRSVGFQTILPPGSPSATSDQGDLTAVMSASSHHGSGSHVLFGDGSVRFVTGTIDAGDPSSPSVGIVLEESGKKLWAPGSKSPYGLWGALGSRASREVVNDQINGGSAAITAPRRSMTPLELDVIRTKPIRTWTAAGGRGTMKGWLVSCSKGGEVVLVNEAGETKNVTLSDLIGEDAYFIVESLLAEKLQARDKLVSQLQEAVGLLEQKDFNTFLRTFVDASQLGLRDVTSVSSMVYLRRGVLIQSFDDAIRVAQAGAAQIEMEGDRVTAVFGDARRSETGLAMFYSNGRWYWLPSR